MILPTDHRPPDASTPPAVFAPGQLVRHRRYGYRGVVVDFDPVCRAEDGWYHGNQTQPDRNQPWYHVLVDGSSVSTYAAQENLLAETRAEPIAHPLLDYFFTAYEHGAYVRNQTPWPGEGA